ncbi:MAG TPA: ABC transporter ATP-binding protein [Candidatus Cloacimonadota bacterium]|nr:ABC transporter ATP-binding protein [Candidatus Cloacimonadota bacterium]HQL14139.1 ABC transporter ATP-binding protein [Candidatus Cloacimonadota bacterium]
MKSKEQNWLFYIRQIIPYLKKDKWLFAFGLFAMLLTSSLQLLDPLILAHIIDKSIPQHNMPDMFKYAGFFIAVIVVSGFLSYLQIILMSRLGIKIITNFKGNVFRHLLKAPLSWFNTQPVGELIAKVENDSERVRSLFSNLSIQILSNIIFFAGVYCVLMFKESRITLLMTVPALLVMVAYYFVVKYLSKFYRRIREMYADITAKVTDFVQGMQVIQLLNQQKKAEKLLFQSSRAKRNLDAKASFIEYGMEGIFLFLFNVVFVIMIIKFSAPKIIIGTMTIGTLFVFIQYIQRLIWPLMSISENVMQIQRAFVSLKRILDLTALPTEEELHPGKLVPQFQHEIRFENVWFAYKDEDWVLKDISFTLRKGQKLALVGASGSGKTTTVGLICGFYEPQKGSILVDGIPLKDLDLHLWRSKIGLILQDIFLFPGNILENVRVYNDAIPEENIRQAINIVQLDDFIKSLPDGLKAELAERGQNISQGEKQLISFARALAFSPEIIIMDEATASIDPQTETRIQQSMERVLTDKTALIVAHRLTSVLDADQILLFKDGEIIHRGSHSELMQKSEEYKRLVELQMLKGTFSSIGQA